MSNRDNNDSVDAAAWSCPLPLKDYPAITLGHGGGGRLSADLVEHLFLPAFANPRLASLADSTVVPLGNQRIAFSTDSFVVRPLFFPGGNIGELAVHGTINDLAMSGAQPVYLSAAFIVEEGFPIDRLAAIARAMGQAGRDAGVEIVAGDTKVVDRGHGDGCYINTAGIGCVPAGLNIGPTNAQPGDAALISGTIGDHGMAIMSVREGLEFESEIESDTAALHDLVATMVAACPTIRVLRDPTRGGVASALNEIATASNVGVVLDEQRLPVNRAVRSACEILGLDPLFVANEGKLLAIVPSDAATDVLAAMQSHRLGAAACQIGVVTADHPRMVVAKTGLGAQRVITMQVGEQLPRIC